MDKDFIRKETKEIIKLLTEVLANGKENSIIIRCIERMQILHDHAIIRNDENISNLESDFKQLKIQVEDIKNNNEKIEKKLKDIEVEILDLSGRMK